MAKQIILASTSARRQELLESVNLQFTVAASPYEEDLTLHEDPETMVREFSQGKARAIANDYPESIIIAADTIVYFENQIFGKPKGKEDALRMLSALQGKTHVVYTGYTIIDTSSKKEVTKVVKTEIKLAELSRKEIEHYFENTPLLDKAGAYAIQGFGATFTEKITGEYTNVVGLPMASLRESLKGFGIELL